MTQGLLLEQFFIFCHSRGSGNDVQLMSKNNTLITIILLLAAVSSGAHADIEADHAAALDHIGGVVDQVLRVLVSAG